MKTNRTRLYIATSWVLSLVVVYFLGWWAGMKAVTHVAATTAHSGMWLVVVALAVVAIVSGVAAFRTRGYFDQRTHSM